MREDITPVVDFTMRPIPNGEPTITATVIRQLWLTCLAHPGVDVLTTATLRLLTERDAAVEVARAAVDRQYEINNARGRRDR